MALIVGTDNDDMISQNGNSPGVTGGLPTNTGDTIQGGNGGDTIYPGTGNNLVEGNADVDALYGNTGNDTLDGGAGDDRLNGLAGDDLLIGGEGNDRLEGTSGIDTLDGGAGDDLLFATGGDTLIDGGPGDDIVYLSGGNFLATVFLNIETLSLAAAGIVTAAQLNAFPRAVLLRNDTLLLELSGGGTIGTNFEFTTGDATINMFGSAAADNFEFGNSLGRSNGVGRVVTIRGQGGDDTITGGTGDDSFTGNDGNDSLVGGAGNDTLGGDDSNDTLIGGLGNDQLAGGPGDDVLFGGPGVDTYFGNGGYDVVSYSDAAAGLVLDLATPAQNTGEAAGEIFDFGQITGFVTTNFADTIRGAAASESLNGLAGDDQINGGGGNDTLIGGTGNDTMAGGTGNDVYQVDAVGDVITEAAGEGRDSVFVLVNGWTVAANIETVYLAAGITALNGGVANDELVANATAGSTLDGGQGNDTLWGQAGNDSLLGGAGNDVLRAGAGNDTLEGGDGQDKLVGGDGADVFVFAAPGWGLDEIFDFLRGDGDRIDMRGSGITSLAGFAAVQTLGPNTQLVAPDGSSVNIYGATGLVETDFIFS